MVDGLGVGVAQVQGHQVGGLARFQRAGLLVHPQGAGRVDGRHAKGGPGRDGAGTAGHTFAEQGGGAQLAEHVQVVVAGGAVRPQGDVDPGPQEPCHRAETAGKLEVGLGAVDHVGPGLRQAGDLGLLELGHVHGDEPGAHQAEAVQPGQGALAVVPQGLDDLVVGLVQVDMDRHLQLVGQGPHPRQGRIGDGVGGVGRKGGADQGVVAEALVQLEPLAQVVVGVLGEVGREVQDDHPDQGTHPGVRRHRGGDLGVEVHVVEAGGPAAQHLQGGQPGPRGDEVRVHPAPLRRPDVLVEPGHERQVVRQTAHQGHGGVGMGIDQPGDQDVPREIQGLPSLDGLGLGAWDQGQDAALCDSQGVVGEDPVLRVHGQDPLGVDEQLRLHGLKLLCVLSGHRGGPQ